MGKKKGGKMAIFGPKPWVNFFGKMSIFPLFELVVFFSLERLFLVLDYHKRHFPNVYCLKKKVGKMEFLDQQHWFFQLLELLVLIA